MRLYHKKRLIALLTLLMTLTMLFGMLPTTAVALEEPEIVTEIEQIIVIEPVIAEPPPTPPEQKEKQEEPKQEESKQEEQKEQKEEKPEEKPEEIQADKIEKKQVEGDGEESDLIMIVEYNVPAMTSEVAIPPVGSNKLMSEPEGVWISGNFNFNCNGNVDIDVGSVQVRFITGIDQWKLVFPTDIVCPRCGRTDWYIFSNQSGNEIPNNPNFRHGSGDDYECDCKCDADCDECGCSGVCDKIGGCDCKCDCCDYICKCECRNPCDICDCGGKCEKDGPCCECTLVCDNECDTCESCEGVCENDPDGCICECECDDGSNGGNGTDNGGNNDGNGTDDGDTGNGGTETTEPPPGTTVPATATTTVTPPPAAPTTPTPEEPPTTIEETTPPTASPDPVLPEPDPPAEDDDDEEFIITIPDPEVPLAPLSDGSAWALMNLILSIAGAIMALMFGLHILMMKRNENEGTLEDSRQKLSRLLLALATPTAAILGLVMFILTQDMRLPMKLVDWYTPAHAAIFYGGTQSYIYACRINKDDDSDDQQPAIA